MMGVDSAGRGVASIARDKSSKSKVRICWGILSSNILKYSWRRFFMGVPSLPVTTTSTITRSS